MRIAYCGFDVFIVALCEAERLGHDIVEIFTSPEDEGYEYNRETIGFAEKNGIAYSVAPITGADIQRLHEKRVDLLLSCAYPHKVPPWAGKIAYGVNIHPSSLPEGRGPWPLPWIILKEMKRSSVTFHCLADRWDRGDLLLQDSFDVTPRETLESLTAKCKISIMRSMENFLDRLPALWAGRQQQKEGSYWNMPSNETRTIDFSNPVADIDRIARAFSKFESFFYLNGKKYFARRVDVWSDNHYLVPGSLVASSPGELLFAASDGFACVSDFALASW